MEEDNRGGDEGGWQDLEGTPLAGPGSDCLDTACWRLMLLQEPRGLMILNMSEGIILPVLTNSAIAPDDLLKVRCTFKTECITTISSCRKHGLVCTSGCNDCRLETCQNCV